ncbi:MAG: lysophospholipid acyltransferase family protein [bacterium]
MQVKHYLEFIAVKILSDLITSLPWRINYWLANRLGEIGYILDAKRRKLAIDNLTHAFKDQYDKKQIKRLAINAFRNMSKSLIEFILFPRLNKDNVNNFVRIKGLENLERAKKKGKGVIIYSGHIGNWELMTEALILKGYNLNLMIRRQKNVFVEKLIQQKRTKFKTKTIFHTVAPKEIFQILKNNEIITIIGDQDGGKGGVFVDFFGRPASTPPGPVVFAMRTGAELIPIFDIRIKNNQHQIIIEPPCQLTTTPNIKTAIVENTQRLTKRLESYIHQYPDQWLWFHNRWATKPDN